MGRSMFYVCTAGGIEAGFVQAASSFHLVHNMHDTKGFILLPGLSSSLRNHINLSQLYLQIVCRAFKNIKKSSYIEYTHSSALLVLPLYSTVLCSTRVESILPMSHLINSNTMILMNK